MTVQTIMLRSYRVSLFLFDRNRIRENYGIYVKAAQSYWLSLEFGKLNIPVVISRTVVKKIK